MMRFSKYTDQGISTGDFLLLLSGKLEYSKDCVVNSHIDLVDFDMLNKKPDPRILHTHLPYSYLPAKHTENEYKI
jgi:hypothetical protein